MAALTVTRILFDADGNIREIVRFESDAQKLDPVYRGASFVDMPSDTYDACKTNRDLLVAVQPLTGDPKAQAAIAARLKAIDDTNTFILVARSRKLIAPAMMTTAPADQSAPGPHGEKFSPNMVGIG